MTNTSIRYAVDPDRALREDDQSFFESILPPQDLPTILEVPTRNGGILTLTAYGDTVHLVVNRPGQMQFFLNSSREGFLELMEGGKVFMPNVGVLIATPRGRDRLRMVLIPERGGRTPWQGLAFEADLLCSETTSKL